MGRTMDRNILGMWLFIVTEAIFFGALILAYVFYHATRGFPTAASTLDPLKTGLFSIALIASSGTMLLAERSLRRQRHGAFVGFLALTVVLGLIFLVGQGTEYWRLFQRNITVGTNLFGTSFFTLTGFHGLHVTGGIIALATLTGLGLGGSFQGPRSSAVETVALYWHFVDAVWIVIFSLIYIWIVVAR